MQAWLPVHPGRRPRRARDSTGGHGRPHGSLKGCRGCDRTCVGAAWAAEATGRGHGALFRSEAGHDSQPQLRHRALALVQVVHVLTLDGEAVDHAGRRDDLTLAAPLRDGLIGLVVVVGGGARRRGGLLLLHWRSCLGLPRKAEELQRHLVLAVAVVESDIAHAIFVHLAHDATVPLGCKGTDLLRHVLGLDGLADGVGGLCLLGWHRASVGLGVDVHGHWGPVARAGARHLLARDADSWARPSADGWGVPERTFPVRLMYSLRTRGNGPWHDNTRAHATRARPQRSMPFICPRWRRLAAHDGSWEQRPAGTPRSRQACRRDGQRLASRWGLGW